MVGCSRPPEQQFLTQFFRAARGRDNTTVGRMSAVMIDPREQGSVEDFSIENIGPETRTPLTFKPLFEAEQQGGGRREGVPQDEDRVSERQHQGDRGSARSSKREPDAKLTPAQQKIKAEWDKWREGIAAHARTTVGATAAIKPRPALRKRR